MVKEVTKKAPKNAKVVKAANDLEKDLQAKRADLVEAKRANAAGELVNPRVITTYRKDIARLMTQINEGKGK